MKIERKVIEEIGGEEISQIRLINDRGLVASILTLGATWQGFEVPDGQGGLKNLVLGHDRPSDYLKNGIYPGQTIGRVAGRIKGGQATIDQTSYQLPQNNNGNTLHGGPEGFHAQNWSYELIEELGQVGVCLTLAVQEAVDGFPGDMTVAVTYILDNEDRLSVTYHGFAASQATLFNPTNHVYFNLGDGDTVADHTLFIAANDYLEADEQLIPSGRRLSVTGTAFDFRQAKNLMTAIEETGGLDHAFEVAVPASNPIAILTHTPSGDQVTLYSDRNALVVYSFNWPEEGVVFSRSKGRTNTKHEGVALEAQTLPDAINHPDFGNIILRPGEEQVYTITYAYDRLN